MNERIKELATKAYLSVNPGPDPYNEAEAAWLGFGPFERKFAELIVRECAKVARNTDLEDVEGGDSAVLYAASEAIENHFKV